MAADGRLGAAILGCGRIAGAFAEPGAPPTTHAQALYEASAFHLVAVSDADGARAAAFAARWNAKVSAPDELAAADLDQGGERRS